MTNYASYMASAAWRRKRAAFQRSGRLMACARCGASGSIHIHHRTYARLGAETFDDLVPLCEPHHAQLHQMQRACGISVEEATDEFVGTVEVYRQAKAEKPPPPAPTPGGGGKRARARQKVSISEARRREAFAEANPGWSPPPSPTRTLDASGLISSKRPPKKRISR